MPLQGLYLDNINSKRRMILKQIIAETDDGFFLRNKRKDFGLSFKDIYYGQRPRFDTASPFGSVSFELDRAVQIVQRRYPTFVDMIARFGGLSRVITFFIFSLVGLHHLVVMDRYILNQTVRKGHSSSKEGEGPGIPKEPPAPHSEEILPFSYLEVFRFKLLFCCTKKSKRFGIYEEL